LSLLSPLVTALDALQQYRLSRLKLFVVQPAPTVDADSIKALKRMLEQYEGSLALLKPK
jgi:hypothetical protein